jgi:hypothetical protein
MPHLTSKQEIKDTDPTIRKAKWAAMKEEFLELSITAKDIHWPTLAAKYGFKPQTARNRASVEKWYSEIAKRRQLREEVLEEKLTERTQLALEKLNEDFATNEVAIRKRHATIARGLQVRAVGKLREVEPDKLSVSEALKMLELGLREERFAMGMPETYEGKSGPVSDVPSDYKPVVEQLGGHKRVQSLGVAILKALQGVALEEPEDVEAHDIGEPVTEGAPQPAAPAPKKIIIKKS